MQKHPDLIVERARRTLTHVLLPGVYAGSAPLRVEALHVRGEPIAPADALSGDYEPFAVGNEWGGAWCTTWFRLTGSIPDDWSGREVVARVRFGFARRPGYGAEGLAYIGGRPVHGLSPNHTDVPLSASALGGDPVELLVEAAANPVTQMDWGRQVLLPEPEGPPLYRLSVADLACVDRKVSSLGHDFRILVELLGEIPRDTPRWWEILSALNEACHALDAVDVTGTADEATRAIADMFARPTAASAHRVSAVGHAHIDTAWLWPLRETIRKCARTFATALALMDEYPEYRFVCSQAQQYAWMKQHYPEIFQRIVEKVRAGQWEPVGSMWVEPDCNVPSGESIVRQLVYGKRFFLEELGYETTDVWLPDAFGYNGALPQLIEQAGCRYFLSQKMSWNELNAFPHHTFWWEGIDGTRVLTHFPPADTYNGRFLLRELGHGVRNFRDHGRSARSLYVYGFGDGGGGPTRDMLETARRVRDLEGLPRVELEPARRFFENVEEESRDLSIWEGELYLEFHRGTYTTQAQAKQGNRRSEWLLREAEMWCVLAGTNDYPAAELEEAWKLVLLNQFHDILPGSSIQWVYRDAAEHYARVEEIATRERDRAMHAVAAEVDTDGMQQPVVVFNALAHERTEFFGGRIITVPPCGYTTVDAVDTEPAAPTMPTSREGWADNGFLRIEWDEQGLLTSITDMREGREVLAPGERGNVLQLHPDTPNQWDAWDVDLYYAERRHDLTDAEEVEVIPGGFRVRRRFGDSSVVQTVTLAPVASMLRVDTEIDWRETHKFLKVAFPVDVRSPRATYEIQFGHVERPTHTNTSWDLAKFEVCGHTWADLSEPGYGVALVNDSKYGHDIRGNVMRLSLLRSPAWPDPDADRGVHRFSYALVPHAGDLRPAGVIEAAHAFNSPLRAIEAVPSKGSRPRTASLAATDRPGLAVSAVKRADRSGDVVVRLYESYGSRGAARVSFGLPVRSATRTDLLERDLEPLDVRDGAVDLVVRPFEVVTLKVRG